MIIKGIVTLAQALLDPVMMDQARMVMFDGALRQGLG